MKGIYLASYKAYHPDYDIIYQDINGKRDLPGDMMDIDLTDYDFIIATPPCNWWARCNWRRNTSEYALSTKHLLPDILHKLCEINKPWIVENVRNKKRFQECGLFDLPGVYVYFVGRHTYWSNIKFKVDDIIQKPIVEIRDGKRIWLSSQNLPREQRQGTQEVHQVIERFLLTIKRKKNMKLTNLQRLGISYMLLDLVYKGAMMLKSGGTISFTEHDGIFNMKISCYSGFVYIQNISENENIDCVYTYSFQWDGTEKLFHIIDIERKEETA